MSPSDSSRLSLRDLESYDPHANATAGERRFLCPLCGDGKPKDSAHRCLAANVATGAWNCHRCGAKGKLLELWEDQKPRPISRTQRARTSTQRAFAVSPIPSVQQGEISTQPPLTQLESVSTPIDAKADWRRQLNGKQNLTGTLGGAYLEEKRHLPCQLAHAAGVRYVPRFYGRPAVVFPVRERSGKVVAAHGRFIEAGRSGTDQGQHQTKTDPKRKCFITVGPRKLGVFASPGALHISQEFVPIITEAPIDALTLAACGYPAITLCGKNGYPNWLLDACAYRRVFLGFDADEKGDEAAETLTAVLLSHGASVYRLRPEGAKDWNALLGKEGRDALSDVLALHVLPHS